MYQPGLFLNASQIKETTESVNITSNHMCAFMLHKCRITGWEKKERKKTVK